MAIVRCSECQTANRVPLQASGRPRCGKCQRDLPWVVDAGDTTFTQAVETAMLVLVDLWAPWCGPCRMVSPILERLAQEFAGRLKVVKVNVDENQSISAQYHATSIPMLLFLQDGKLVDKLVGAHPEPALRAKIQELMV